MAKQPRKPQGNSNTPQNSLNLDPRLDSELSKNQEQAERIISKSRQQINQENYQKNKAKRNAQAKARYQQQKLQDQQQEKEQLSKYYGAEAIKVLISLKQYTELNQEKKKQFLNFVWTLKSLTGAENKDIKISNIVEIMKLREEADKLINDYWDTAKNETKKGKSWNSLDYDEQQRLIKYWGYEKSRIENGYIEEEERLEKQSQKYLKEIELAKYHEERGKIKCPCYSCEAQREIQKEVKAKIDKELKELEQKEAENEKGECCVCGKVRELEEEAGACKKCSENYGD